VGFTLLLQKMGRGKQKPEIRYEKIFKKMKAAPPKR